MMVKVVTFRVYADNCQEEGNWNPEIDSLFLMSNKSTPYKQQTNKSHKYA